MEYLYSSYSKLVNDEILYFVKKIMTFPEFQGVAEVVVGYGMHTNFEKACSIAGIDDIACRQQLSLELVQRNLPKLPKVPYSEPTIQAGNWQKSREKHAVLITTSVNRLLARRGAEVLN
jgi:hypothetical protein